MSYKSNTIILKRSRFRLCCKNERNVERLYQRIRKILMNAHVIILKLQQNADYIYIFYLYIYVNARAITDVSYNRIFTRLCYFPLRGIEYSIEAWQISIIQSLVISRLVSCEFHSLRVIF